MIDSHVRPSSRVDNYKPDASFGPGSETFSGNVAKVRRVIQATSGIAVDESEMISA
jgi:hypothetical protein